MLCAVGFLFSLLFWLSVICLLIINYFIYLLLLLLLLHAFHSAVESIAMWVHDLNWCCTFYNGNILDYLKKGDDEISFYEVEETKGQVPGWNLPEMINEGQFYSIACI